MEKTTIKISEVLAPIVGSRDVADVLKKLIKKNGARAVDLDFKDVEFVSRSAAHELLLLKEELSHRFLRKRTINFVNASDSVAEMLRIVAASRALPKSREEEYTIEKVDISSLQHLPAA